MKFKQKKEVFRPFSITFEGEQEAINFLSIIDKIDWKRNNANSPPDITKEEYEVVRQISDAFTNEIVQLPTQPKTREVEEW